MLHHHVGQVKTAVPAPQVTKAEGKATGGDVQGLGRFRHALGQRDLSVLRLLEVASLSAYDCKGFGSSSSSSFARTHTSSTQAG